MLVPDLGYPTYTVGTLAGGDVWMPLLEANGS